jgi:hypothetical protein
MGANCLTTTLIYAGQALYVPNNPTITPPPTKIPALKNTPTIFKDFTAYFYSSTCSVDLWVTAVDPEGLLQVYAYYNINGLPGGGQSAGIDLRNSPQPDSAVDYSKPLVGSRSLVETSIKIGDVLYYQFVAIDGQAIVTASSIYAVAISPCPR